MKQFFDYENVRLIPKKGIVKSRTFCDTSVELGKFKFDLPVYPSNMKSVVDKDTCIFLSEKNIFYTYHRFHDNYIKEQIEFCKLMRDLKHIVSISIGVQKQDYVLIDNLLDQKLIPDFITIDIAHGHSRQMEEMLKHLKTRRIESFLIAGNICTIEAVKDLEKWGANCLKIGLGPGKSCISYNKTGVGSRGYQLSCIKECAENSNIPIIADGGIVHHGDIAKSLSCKANLVMAGSLFSAYDQSAGRLIEIEEGSYYKEYYGSASKYNKKELKNIEGKKMLIKYRGDMNRLLKELKEDLQSSISYIGGKNISDLRKAEYYII